MARRYRGIPLRRLLATWMVLTLIVPIVVMLATPAFARWSVVAVDADSGEVGIALASCAAADFVVIPRLDAAGGVSG